MTASQNARHPPGFFGGAGVLFRSFGFVVGRPRLWPAALVPVGVLVALSAASAAAAVIWVRPALRQAWGAPTSAWTRWGAEAGAWAAVVAVAGLGLIAAFVAAPPLSAPALERIVLARERALGVPERLPLGFWRGLACGIQAQVFGLAGVVLALVGIGILEILAPPAVVLTMPLRWVVSALALAWNLLDYPLTLRGWSMRARWAAMRRHAAACFGFGLAFAALFSIPCFSLLMLPIGVAGAAELTVRMTQE